MDEAKKKLAEFGIKIPEILLPKEMNLKQWAVVACDQFTQDKNYWTKVKETAAGAPSTLEMILPEAFLEDGNLNEKIDGINRNMSAYLDNGIFAEPHLGFMYIERDTPFNSGRKGLVAAVDLEKYDWSPASRPMIRSTEGTVADRLPPRMDIRRNAPIETPHILLLIDDETNTLLPALGKRAKKNNPAYQGELMLNSGSISGWYLDAEDDMAFFANELKKLASRTLTRYGVCKRDRGDEPFLFAVGDGNHSLASAKGIWEEVKAKNNEQRTENKDFCRYALVEIENIYDPAIKFEPIHRVMFGLSFDKTLDLLSVLPDFEFNKYNSFEELVRWTSMPVLGNCFGIFSCGNGSEVSYAVIKTSATGISTACLQPLLDSVVYGDVTIDYIHGEDELFRIVNFAAGKNTTGILLPPVQKAGFFETIARSGPLPRKSFSMGEASEKRFYVECRKLSG